MHHYSTDHDTVSYAIPGETTIYERIRSSATGHDPEATITSRNGAVPRTDQFPRIRHVGETCGSPLRNPISTFNPHIHTRDGMQRRTVLVGLVFAGSLVAVGLATGLAAATPDGEHTPDDDHLNSSREIELGTDPHDPDTDNDGLRDGVEVRHYETDPVSVDTDGDGYYDSEEIVSGADPTDSSSQPETSPARESTGSSTTAAVTDATDTATTTNYGSPTAIIGGLATTIVGAVVTRRLL